MVHSKIITVFSYQTTGFNICVVKRVKKDIFEIYLATVARISVRNLEGGNNPAFLTPKMWCGLNLPTIIEKV